MPKKASHRYPLLDYPVYKVPDFLKGRCAPAVYEKWLENKADTLLKRDRKRRKPYAAAATKSIYKQKIHAAVCAGGERDPFTGDKLAWELISKWDTSHEQEPGYKKQFALMPTVDHIDPDLLEFEICSWLTNDCKSDLDPAGFVALCRRIAHYRGTDGYIRKWKKMKLRRSGNTRLR